MQSKQIFINRIKNRAAANPQMIVFPEAEIDNRVTAAAHLIAKEKIAYPILLGNEKKILEKLKEYSPKVSDNIQIIDHTKDSKQKEFYIQQLTEIRKHKGVTPEKASEMLNNINYYGTMMVQEDHAHGMVTGTTFPTDDSIRPALQIIKTKERFQKVSSFFFMVLDKKVYLFADCAINIDPNSHDLANIALDTAETAKKFNIEPKIAFLSFSTNSSADHPHVDKVKEAVGLAKNKNPDILIEGEMQVDTAIVPEVAHRKWPESQICGQANVLIFPDLNSGNIAYKLVQRLAGAEAVGPILQGLKKPVNDLSRGCDVEDIVNMAAITSIEAQDIPYS